ncbi:MAG: hypothetical protein AB7L65_09610, partial [Hyphomonadaceae bacterium]
MTRQPSHHPSSEVLLAYAAGTLPAGFDIVAAAHIRGCRQCRRDVAAFESAGGAMLGSSEGAALGDDALARVLSRLDAPALEAPPAPTLDDLLSAAKRRWVSPGVWVAQVPTPHAPQDRVYLLSAAPGAATAKHGHQGREFTQVLSGALLDDGVVYGAGDFT